MKVIYYCGKFAFGLVGEAGTGALLGAALPGID
jgi:hypothetical protein